MLSFISGIWSSLQQAKNTKSQGTYLRSQGRIARSNAERKAADIMRTADLNWELAQQKRLTERENQTAAVGTARSRQGASGFTSEGAGHKRENLVRNRYDEDIANMARSADITYTNYFNSAMATRTQGRLQQEALNAEAEQYDIAAKAMKRSITLSSIMGAAGAAYGFYQGGDLADAYNKQFATEIAEGKKDPLSKWGAGYILASNYSADLANNTMGFNPYTVGMTRKQNWRSFAAIAEGSSPGWQKSEFTL